MCVLAKRVQLTAHGEEKSAGIQANDNDDRQIISVALCVVLPALPATAGRQAAYHLLPDCRNS